MAEFVHVDDLNIPALSVYSERSENRLYHWYEPESGVFIAESARVIERALAAGYRPESVLMEEGPYGLPGTLTGGEETPLLHALFENEPVPVYTAPPAVLKKITGYHLTGGILASMRRKKLPSLSEVADRARRIAVMDHVTNPTNVGAVVRSAAALGMDAVVLADGCCDPLARRAVRVSMGCIFQIPWTCVRGDRALTDELRAKGYTTIGMALRDDSRRIDDPSFAELEKMAVFLGNEGDGLPESVLNSLDYTVKIPMYHGVDSLNVAAASAVAFWALRRVHDPASPDA